MEIEPVAIKKSRIDIVFYTTVTLLSLVVLAGYIFIASNSYFFQDDFHLLYPVVFGQYSFPGVSPGSFFRPLSRELFFIASYRIFHLEPFGYFLINIIVHTLSAICLFFLLVKLRLSNKLSVLVAFMFFSNVTAFAKIYWISNFQHTSYQLFLILSGLFVLLSVDTYGLRKISLLSLSLSNWIFALLSNQAGILFPNILMLLLTVKFWQKNNAVKKSGVLPFLIKTTFMHWIILLIYVIFVFIPSWKQPEISHPYYIELSIRTFFENMVYYCKSTLFSNAKDIFLIPLVILYPLIFFRREIREFVFTKHGLLNFITVLSIFGFIYAPFAFLKYQRQPNYVSLALVPLYILVFYPLVRILSRSMYNVINSKVLAVLILCLLVLSFLPSKSKLRWYFKNSPVLHMDPLCQQVKSILPEIPTGITKVVFVNSESFVSHKDVQVWQTPPFWWHTGFGNMFNIIYNRKDVKFEICSDKIITSLSNTIFVRVDKRHAYYSLTLIKKEEL